MEQFSQSRGDVDLFDDEITPMSASELSEVAQQVENLSVHDFEPSKPLQQHQGTLSERARGRGRGRGRGQIRGRGALAQAPSSDGLSASKFAPKQHTDSHLERSATEHAQDDSNVTTDGTKESNNAQAEPTTELPENQKESSLDSPSINTPTSQSQPSQPQRTPAVRGDRLATGGVRKPKLTEEELNARLAAAKAKSQSLAEKHARAQADAADFEERERLAQQKRAEEAKRAKVMEGERAQNRVRKMQALGGREWDKGKKEEDLVPRRYGEKVRRDAPVEEDDLRIYEWRDEDARGRGDRGRGRNGRGRGRGEYRGGRGRGWNGQTGVGQVLSAPDVKAVEDFPALPGKKMEPRPQQERKDSEGPAGGTWADQMSADAGQ